MVIASRVEPGARLSDKVCHMYCCRLSCRWAEGAHNLATRERKQAVRLQSMLASSTDCKRQERSSHSHVHGGEHVEAKRDHEGSTERKLTRRDGRLQAAQGVRHQLCGRWICCWCLEPSQAAAARMAAAPVETRAREQHHRAQWYHACTCDRGSPRPPLLAGR